MKEYSWRTLLKRPWVLPASAMAAALLLGSLLQCQSPKSAPPADEFEIDTHIPRGYVLVPITVHNSENVDSIFGTFGMVDLYPVKEDGKVESLAVIRAVKMLRAPRNPNQFGVLVPSGLAGAVVRSASAFAVVVLNRERNGTVLEKPLSQKPRRIILEGDEP